MADIAHEHENNLEFERRAIDDRFPLLRKPFAVGIRVRLAGPVYAYRGIARRFPRMTALVNMDESAVIILSAKVGHLSVTQRSRTS